MGFFDKLFNENKSKHEFVCKDELEAWIGILLATISSDNDIAESETNAFLKIIVFNRKFEDYDDDDIMNRYKKVLYANMNDGIGWQEIINSCKNQIDKDDISTVFSMAVELAYANGEIDKNEINILEHIAQMLELNNNECKEIIKVMSIRFKYNYLLN